MKYLLKALCLLLIVSITASLTAGCRSEQTAIDAKGLNEISTALGKAQSSETNLNTYNLKLVMPNVQPPAQNEVIAEIDRVSKDELNIKLSVTYIPWGDYVEKVKMMSAVGDIFDIFLNFFNEFSGSVARNQAMPLNDLLDKYGQDLKNTIPASEFEGLTIDGVIYGIPAIYPRTETDGSLLIRKDFRGKYNIPEVNDLATFEKYLDAIKKGEPGIAPISGTPNMDRWFTAAHKKYRTGSDRNKFLFVDTDQRPLKVQNWYKTDLFKTTAAWNAKAYENGWFTKDVLTNKDPRPLFISGKAGAMAGDLFNIVERQGELSKNIPGAEIELVIMDKSGEWRNAEPANNYAQISSTSKDPERAMMFMNWLRKNRDNYDLYMYGIKGKQYTLKGDQIELPAGVSAGNNPYAPTPWFAIYFPYFRTATTDPEAFSDALNFWRNIKPVNSPLLSFQFNSDNVKAEMATVDKVCEEIGRPIEQGLLTDEASYQRLLNELDHAGMERILAEFGKQLNDYSKRKDIK